MSATAGAAAHVAGWAATQGRRGTGMLTPTGSAGSPPIAGPNDPIGLRVELYMGGQGWVDVSPQVYYRDRIRIQRGRSNETSQTPPQTAGLTLNNRGGTFTPRNRSGPYYGLIGRNTPVRISRAWNGGRFYRYAGEVPAWPTTSDISGRDVYEQISAAGPLRRLVQGSAPLGSSLLRAYTVPAAAVTFSGASALPLVAYWPAEGGTYSTSITSGLSGGTAMTVTGSPKFATNTGFVGSQPLPVMNGSSWLGQVPTYTGGTDNVVNFLLSIPSAGETDGAIVCRLFTVGTVARLDMKYLAANNGSLQLFGYNAFGTQVFSGSVLTGYNGVPIRAQMVLEQFGTSLFVELHTLAAVAGGSGTAGTAGTLSSAAVGNAASVTINPGGVLVDSAIGHISVQSSAANQLDDSFPVLAWTLDTPDADSGGTPSRINRLCREQGVPVVVMTSPAGYDTDNTAAPIQMGYQLPDTFLNLIQQGVDAGAGLLFETRDQVSLAVRTRASLYNQPAKLTLDHSQHQLSAPLNPLDDDAYTRNDITVTRIGGSSVVAQQTTGPLSIQSPPNGVGDYQTDYTLSLFNDSLLRDIAGWRLHMGTVDEPRYPQISLNLRHPTFTGSVDMMNAALTLDIGDRILIVNPPPELPPDPISLIVQGYTETLGIYEHDMVINCSPESPYEIAILEDPVLGHADTDGSTLSAPILGSDVTFTVATTGAASGSPPWTTNGADFPFDVNIGGERMTVPNITGASSPQFFTNVVRAVNGTPIPLGADGTFETGITGWAPTAGTFAASTAQAHSGTHSGLLTVTGSPSQTFVRTPMIPVTPGTAIAATQWVLTASGSPHCLCVIDFFDAGQNYLSSYSSPAVTAPGSWTVQQSVTTVPDGVAFAQIGPTVNLSPPAGTAIYVDDVTFTTVPTHAAGTDVRLWQPMILSL